MLSKFKRGLFTIVQYALPLTHISQPPEQLEISVKHQSVPYLVQFYGHQTLPVPLNVIEDTVAPVVVETTVVKAVVKAVENNNNKRGPRRLREQSPDDSIKQQRILRPRLQ